MAIRSASSRLRMISYALAAGALASLLAACDGNAPSSATTAAGSDLAGQTEQAQAKVGDATVYVTIIQTSAIPGEVAREHGISQRDDLIMLRVSPRRQGSDGETVSAPIEVQAVATQLGAAPRALVLKQVVVNDLVDHMGTIEVQLPTTVSFQVTVVTPGGARETLNLSGDFKLRP